VLEREVKAWEDELQRTGAALAGGADVGGKDAAAGNLSAQQGSREGL
jgi:hypothetical protein